MQFLFRFRDLVASTIYEHNKIIQDKGSCLWGWWKRPSEDSRTDVWTALASTASVATPQWVGLFDSRSGKTYRALVTEVIPPKSSDVDARSTMSVPKDQEEFVPLYYRESPFSRAWMRFTRIEEVSDFFSNYSFAAAPKLPGYTPATLKRLRDKKIMTADELRLMDTTIWEVRQSRASDPSEQILLSISALSAAVTQDVIRCKSDEVLHITDLHFALGGARDQHVWRLESENSTRHTLVEAITTALAGRKIGLVIASGDFTFVGSEAEFNEAASAISLLLGILDLSPDHLIIIPGNHDIQWSTTATYDHNSKVDQAPPEAQKNYKSFYERLMRHETNRHLAMGRRYVLPSGLVLEVCALNSSSLMTGKNYLAGMGRIDEASFTNVANEFGWADAKTLAFRLLVIHHHLAVTEDLEPASGYGQGYGIAVDSVRVQRMAAKLGVHLAIHGHKHRAFLWRSTVFELPESARVKHRLGELSIVGGGSAGSSETEGHSNYFNILNFGSNRVNFELYRSKYVGVFEKIQEWSAGISLPEGEIGLRLGDWQFQK